MKILLINKYHYLKGGAERAYFDTAKLLIDHGHEVAFFSMSHPQNEPTEWSKYFIEEVDYGPGRMSFARKAGAMMNIFWNRRAAHNLEKLIAVFKPDIAHLHNIYHQLSPSVISVLRRNGIPSVMTLHDYKMISPNYHLMVRGHIWEKAKGGHYYKCVVDKCVKDSYVKSLVCALEAYFHEWIDIYNKIDLYISPSQFLVDKFKEFGWQKPITVLPNPLLSVFNDNNSSGRPFEFKYILFFGRLSPEKGVGDLIRAYAQLDTGEKSKLVIAGDGPERIDLEKLIERQGLAGRVLLAGHKTGSEIKRIISEAEFIVVPSKWYENAPYSVIEAMAAGKTVICSDLGGLTEMVEAGVSGLLFKPGHIGELAKKMEVLLGNNNLEYMGEQAKKLVLKKHDPEKYYQKLMELYRGVIKNIP